jgi:hypothetical protein
MSCSINSHRKSDIAAAYLQLCIMSNPQVLVF